MTTADPPTQTASEGGSPDVIDYALPCDRCGYDLRTRRHNDACPECGQAVAHTLAVWRGVRPDAARIHALARSLRTLAASLTITALLLPCTLGIMMLLESFIRTGDTAEWLGAAVLGLGVTTEYALWALGMHRLRHAVPTNQAAKRAGAFGWATLATAMCAVAAVVLMASETLNDGGLAILVLAIAATQFLRLASVTQAWSPIFRGLDALRLKNHAFWLALAAAFALITCGALGITHAAILLEDTGLRAIGEAALGAGIIAALACFPTAALVAVTLWITAVAVHRRVRHFRAH